MMAKVNRLQAVLAILAVATGLQAAYFTVDRYQTRNCLQNYTIATNEALQARTDIADRRQDSMNRFLTGLLKPHSPATGRKLAEAYLEEQRQLDREREANPLPSVPECKD